MKKLHWSLLVACALLCSAAPLSAQSKDSDKDKSDKSSQPEKTTQPDKSNQQNKSSQNQDQPAYLGVAIEPVHHGVARHMGDKLKRGQGLLVVNVHEGSPAEKAGIKEHDILTSVDDQRLYSEEQLAKLIHSEKVGDKLKLSLLRDGKSENVTATLGERPADFDQWAHHPAMQQRGYRGDEQADDSRSPEWQSFDAMTLKKTGKNTFKVEISYLDDKGKTQKHSFEGTRADIRKQIRSEKDMRPIERHHLMRSLDLATGEMPIFFFPDFGPGGPNQGQGQGSGDEGEYQ
jgi:membrane-associated protease RseP (regulator of RpoE activity)